MATDTNMQKVSFYSATVWKEIFDTLTKALEKRGEMSFTLVTHGPRNFVRESIGENGEIDSKKLFANLGGFYECSSVLKDEVLNPFIQEKISFAAVDRMDIGKNGQVKTTSCFAIDSKDIERANVIIDRLNRNVQRENSLSREELLKYCADRQINLCGTSRVEKEIRDVLVAENKLTFPHALIRNMDGSYDLRLPAQYEEEAKNAIKDAVILCSGITREGMIERAEKKTSAILDVMAKASDDGKAYIIVDAERPDHFIQTDAKGLHAMVRTPEGDREIGYAERVDPRFKDKAYAFMADYIKPVALEASDRSLDSKLEQIRQDAQKSREIGYTDKIEYYKRGFSDFIRDTMERGVLQETEKEKAVSGRLLDNRYTFKAAIDHAVITKQDELMSDLKSDLGLNDRVNGKDLPETAIDLSDLNGGETFEQVFCRQLLGSEEYADLDEYKSAEDALIHNVRFEELMQESEEVKQGVLREIRQTYLEVSSMDYSFDDMTRAEFVKEISDREQENAELHMDYEIE